MQEEQSWINFKADMFVLALLEVYGQRTTITPVTLEQCSFQIKSLVESEFNRRGYELGSDGCECEYVNMADGMMSATFTVGVFSSKFSVYWFCPCKIYFSHDGSRYILKYFFGTIEQTSQSLHTESDLEKARELLTNREAEWFVKEQIIRQLPDD